MNQIVAGVVAGMLAVTALSAITPAGAGEAPPTSVEGLPGTLRLNELQTIGTHNSYHLQPPQWFLNAVAPVYPDARLLEYSHLPLDQQFDTQRIRQIELDVYADSAGGRFAAPTLSGLFGIDPISRPEMFQPGFKVLHINDLDFLTTCSTFVRCLTSVRDWSAANPGHLPIMILVEVKATDDLPPELDFLGPAEIEPPTVAQLDALDAEIRSVFAEDELITPDFVRGGAATLNEAVTGTGWPTLDQTAGRVMFALDNESLRSMYLTGRPNLEGRAMFTPSVPGAADAAFLKMNDPSPAIADRVQEGYVVRTRADNTTEQARSGDTTQRDAALASGAQWVSTDWPVPGLTDRFGTDYVAQLPGTGVARCNPVIAATACDPPPPVPPVNDAFAGGQVLTGRNGLVTGTNVDATLEAGEPAHARDPGGASVWYRWRAPRSGTVTVSTRGSDFDTVLAAYKGGTIGALQLQDANADRRGHPYSRVRFPVVAGRTYRIAVDGAGGATGEVTLRWSLR